jgi:hypothetical protein
MVAFDRLLARLVQSQPDQWIVQGGMALQLRPGDRARPTKDIDPLVEPVEYLVAPALLSFAEFDPVIVPCYPISQQLAEKWDAYVRTYASGASSQIKDFIDIVLFAEMGKARGRR